MNICIQYYSFVLGFYEYTNTISPKKYLYSIRKTNTNLLFNSYPNQIAKSAVRPSLLGKWRRSKNVLRPCFSNLGRAIFLRISDCFLQKK